jgi:hypothetical protein
MGEFLKFFNEKVKDYPMHLEIYYSRIMDWCINIWKSGSGKNGGDLMIANAQSRDMELCFAKAQVKLKEWLLENQGGY